MVCVPKQLSRRQQRRGETERVLDQSETDVMTALEMSSGSYQNQIGHKRNQRRLCGYSN